ncbi:uncharacterized protein LOC143145972 [Ptiloglossa arizonensis]|uniref:uncharacterized protein LOC143145972 n=1 Tax=Ptiloglossa arizonensis TaxID=3350558 RepID=UPI003F9FB1BD
MRPLKTALFFPRDYGQYCEKYRKVGGAIRSRIEFRTCPCKPHEFFPGLPLGIARWASQQRTKNERNERHRGRRAYPTCSKRTIEEGNRRSTWVFPSANRVDFFDADHPVDVNSDKSCTQTLYAIIDEIIDELQKFETDFPRDSRLKEALTDSNCGKWFEWLAI